MTTRDPSTDPQPNDKYTMPNGTVHTVLTRTEHTVTVQRPGDLVQTYDLWYWEGCPWKEYGGVWTVADTPTGADRAPDRYTAKGRETIDRMRDLAHDTFAGTLGARGADRVFAYLCDAQALKYDDHHGLKGTAEDAAYDTAKASWYRKMAQHALGKGPDPRAARADYVPYAACRTPRAHPRVGDTYTDATGVARVLEGPDANGNVKVRFANGREFWTAAWGFWSAGTYARRDARHDPHVGDTKTYAAPYDREVYTVTSLDPFAYGSVACEGATRAGWESFSGMSCTWTCVEDLPARKGGAS